MRAPLLVLVAGGLLGVVVALLFIGIAPGPHFPALQGTGEPFVMYLPDEKSCVKAAAESGRLFLSDCTETTIWTLVAGLLREHGFGECLTAVVTEQVQLFEHFSLQLRVQLQGGAAINLTSEDAAEIGQSLEPPGVLFGMMNGNVSVRLAPCWDRLPHAGPASNVSQALRDAQTWSLEGPDIAKQGWESGCLTIGPQLFGVSTWNGDERDNSSSRLTDCFMADLSMVLQLRQCQDPDMLCGGRGVLSSDGSCACDCQFPWAGRLCHEPSVNATEQALTCSDEKELGPAGDWDLGHQWLQLRVHLFKLCRLPVVLVKGFLFLGLLAEAVLACICMLLCGCHLVASRGDLRTSAIPLVCLLIFPAFMLVGVPLLICFVLTLLSIALIIYYLHLAVIFPIYAKIYAGRWPHADRAILFCVGETAFSTYIFLPYCLMIALSLMDTAKMVRSVPSPLDPNKILSMSMPFTNADKLVGQEFFNVVPLTGLFAELLRRSALQAISGIYLLLVQLAEVALLWMARKDEARFFKYEFVFAMCQDLPQFLLSAFLLLTKQRRQGEGVDQFEVYGLATGFAALLVQLVRAAHGSLCPAAKGEMAGVDVDKSAGWQALKREEEEE